MTFVVGDKVKHKSNPNIIWVVTHIVGSQEMPAVLKNQAKITGFQENDVWCEWVDDAGKKQYSFFHSVTLEKQK
jgi:uncharacterized protein YodC (DUF2158 family)